MEEIAYLPEYNYFQITVSKWSGKPTCQSSDTIDKVLSDVKIGVAITDYYFDSDDYSSPLKINVNDALRFHLLNGYTKNVNLRVRRNDVSDQKSPYFIDPSDSYSFFSVGDVSQDTSAFSYEPDLVLRINIILDSKYNVIDRKVYSLGDMFGQIGGMDSIMINIGSIIVGIFSSKIFIASLLSTFYHVSSEQNSSKVVPFAIFEKKK